MLPSIDKKGAGGGGDKKRNRLLAGESYRFLSRGGTDVRGLLGEEEEEGEEAAGGEGDARPTTAATPSRPGAGGARGAVSGGTTPLRGGAGTSSPETARPRTTMGARHFVASDFPPERKPSALRFAEPPPAAVVADEPFYVVVELLDAAGQRLRECSAGFVWLVLEQPSTDVLSICEEAAAGSGGAGGVLATSGDGAAAAPTLGGRCSVDLVSGRASFVASRLHIAGKGTGMRLRACYHTVGDSGGGDSSSGGVSGGRLIECLSEEMESISWFHSLRELSEVQLPWFVQSLVETQPEAQRPASAATYLVPGGPLALEAASAGYAADGDAGADGGAGGGAGGGAVAAGATAAAAAAAVAAAGGGGGAAGAANAVAAAPPPVQHPPLLSESVAVRRLDALLASLGDEAEVEQWLYATAFSSDADSIESLETLAALDEADVQNAFELCVEKPLLPPPESGGGGGGGGGEGQQNAVEQCMSVARIVRVIRRHFERLESEAAEQCSGESDVDRVLLAARRKFVELGGSMSATGGGGVAGGDGGADGGVDGYLRGGQILKLADWAFRVLHPQGEPLTQREREKQAAKLLVAVECPAHEAHHHHHPSGEAGHSSSSSHPAHHPAQPDGTLSFLQFTAYIRQTVARIARYRAHRVARTRERKKRADVIAKSKAKKAAREARDAPDGGDGKPNTALPPVAGASGRGSSGSGGRGGRAGRGRGIARAGRGGGGKHGGGESSASVAAAAAASGGGRRSKKELRAARKEQAEAKARALQEEIARRELLAGEAAEERRRQEAALKALVRVLWKVHSLKDAARQRAVRAKERLQLERAAACATARAASAAASAAAAAWRWRDEADAAVVRVHARVAAAGAARQAQLAVAAAQEAADTAAGATAAAATRLASASAVAAAKSAASMALRCSAEAQKAADTAAAKRAAGAAAAAAWASVGMVLRAIDHAEELVEKAVKEAEELATRAAAEAAHNAALAAEMARRVAWVCARRAKAAADYAAEQQTNGHRKAKRASAAAALIAVRAAEGCRQTLKKRLGEMARILRRMAEDEAWKRRMALLAGERAFQVKVNLSTWGASSGGVVLLHVKPGLLISEVKARLAQLDETVPANRMRLKCCIAKRRGGERWTEDDDTVASVGLKSGSTLLVDRLCDDKWREKAAAEAEAKESYLLTDPSTD